MGQVFHLEFFHRVFYSARGSTNRNAHLKPSSPSPFADSLLAWYFVIVWGSGFIATKIGIQYAAPFTFLSLRFAFGLACLIPLVLWLKPTWPTTRNEWLHILIAGLLMHAIHLSGSHYAQYLGMSAGIADVSNCITANPSRWGMCRSRSRMSGSNSRSIDSV